MKKLLLPLLLLPIVACEQEYNSIEEKMVYEMFQSCEADKKCWQSSPTFKDNRQYSRAVRVFPKWENCRNFEVETFARDLSHSYKTSGTICENDGYLELVVNEDGANVALQFQSY